MATTNFGWDTPTVGADADTWGSKLNAIFVSQDTVLASPANTIKGNNTGSTAIPINLTPVQTTAMLTPVVGASQGGAGTKGLVTAPTAGQQNRVLAGDGTWRAGLGRAFGCTITTTNVNGSQPTLTGSLNVASISTLTVVGSIAAATVTFTNAVTTPYQVHVTAGASNFSRAGYGTPTSTTVIIYWETAGGNPTELAVSGF